MKIFRKISAGLLLMTLMVASMFQPVMAEDNADNITYTIFLSAGNQGKMIATDCIETYGSQAEVALVGDQIRISNLNYGDKITMDVLDGSCVEMKEDGKYYIKGVRQSGKDNSAAVAAASFSVTCDEEYVIAYGIAGDLVAYTVDYLDENGNKLLDSRTYYGAVGDKPVVAFRYIDGYVPTAYNLTKTLVSDASQNVFPFVYRPGTMPAITPAGQQPTETTPAAGADAGAAGATGADAGAGAGAGGAAAGPVAPGGDAGAVDNPAAGPADNAAGGDVANPDENNPQGPQEVQDLDDEQVPLANGSGDGADAGTGGDATVTRTRSIWPIVGGVGIAVAAVALIIVLAASSRKKKATKDVEQKDADKK